MLKAIVNSPVRSGDQTIVNGDLVIGTSGEGVNFTANTPAAGMTSQLLNWYEEGTFTPTIVGSTTAGTGTYTAQDAYYTRIGRQVSVYGRVAISAHTGTGNILIGGLPFTIGRDYPTGSIRVDSLALTASNYPVLFGFAGNTTLNIQQGPVGGGSLTNVPMDTNCDMTFGITYFV